MSLSLHKCIAAASSLAKTGLTSPRVGMSPPKQSHPMKSSLGAKVSGAWDTSALLSGKESSGGAWVSNWGPDAPRYELG